MSNPAIVHVEYVFIDCYRCGVAFGVPRNWLQRRREDGRTFCCPNRHEQCYPRHRKEKGGESEAQREERRKAARLIHEEDQAAAKAAEQAAQPIPPAPQEQPDGLRCPDCGKLYRSHGPYRKHLKAIHGKESAPRAD
jgi:hypothetical protein